MFSETFKSSSSFKIFQCRSLTTMRKHTRAVSVKCKCIEMIIIWPNLILSPAFSGKWKNNSKIDCYVQEYISSAYFRIPMRRTILSNPWGPTLRIDHRSRWPMRFESRPKGCRVLPGGNVTDSDPTKNQEGFKWVMADAGETNEAKRNMKMNTLKTTWTHALMIIDVHA